MPAPDLLLAALPVPFPLLPGWDSVLAYGPAPGMELIPYFLALLAWVAMALAGVLLWPLTGLLRRLRRGRNAPPAEAREDSGTAQVPQPPGPGGSTPA